MNKRIFFSIPAAILLSLTTHLWAQVAINNDSTQPDPSAGLDVKFADKGFLPPRVALTSINSANPIVAPAVGLIVYNTANAGTPPNNVIIGYYRWDGARWIAIEAPQGINIGDMQYWNGTQWVKIPAGLNGQVLTFNNGVPTWGGVQLPMVSTQAIYDITDSTAGCGIILSTNGGGTIEAQGVCWSTLPNPTTSDTKTNDLYNTFWTLTGLIPNTQYYVRGYAANSVGTAYGNQVTFSTLASEPTIITTAVSAITQSTASSGGNVTSDGGATVTARGVCWSTTPNPTTANSKTTDGTGTGSFSSSLTGLIGNTVYYVRAYATNSAGTSYGNEVSFTTTPTIPTLTTTTVTNITQTTATSGGNITSNGGSAVIFSGVCWSTNQNPTISDSKSTDGGSIGVFVSNLTGLAPNTTYYVRAYAMNSIGTAYGNQVSFATLPNASLPTVTTTAVTAITQTTATSGGNVTSNGGSSVTARGVCWSTTSNPTTANSKTIDGSGNGSFTSSLTGLTANTLYYVRAYATNSVGTSYGDQVTFNTLTTPTISTTTATAIAQTTATSGGNVTSDGGSTVTARGVCWSTTSNPTTANSKTIDGSGTGSFTSSLTGLTANTLYYVRAYATNSVGTSYGNQVIFTTLANLPTVTTTSATSITQTTATSGGNATSDGGATVTARGVCWSTTSNPTTANNKTIDGSGIGGFTSSLTGLTPNTLYFVRAYATNSIGTAYGNQITLITLANLPTVTTASLTSITQTTATSGGNVTSDGGASVTARGVCWSTAANPTISNSKTTDGTGTGVFVSNLTGLLGNTLYYVRAYATNSAGTSYGNEVSFSTLPTTPSLTTTSVTGITLSTAISGGTVSSNGGASVTARGVCWSTAANPTISNSKTTDGTGTGVFVSNLTGLTGNTLYYLRAYATNSAGTSYGNEVSFSTLDFAIGLSYQGGVIFYINGTGNHGMIAAPMDLTGEGWGCYGTYIGGTLTGIGTGQNNTGAIVMGCSDVDFAAKTCYELVLNGYSDWYLPSLDELNLMYINQAAIGGFSTFGYWSSTQVSATTAYYQGFANGTQYVGNKSSIVRVRPIRSF